jgi:O-antigen ligase/polysaccharide polymerase Wzy-like membrane protein
VRAGEPAQPAIARPLNGERLAVRAAALAIAGMPLLIPSGPSNVGPIDLLIMLTIGAALFWSGMSPHRWRFPYAAPIAVFIAGGAVGALRGPVPGTGAIALVQDVVLLLWCWALANIASEPERMRVLVKTWCYSAVVWASLLFVGLLTSTHFLTGQTTREGSRTSLTFIDPNISGNYWFISLMVIWATGYPKSVRWRRVAYGLLVAAIVTTGSSGAIVSLIVGVGIAAVFGVYRRSGLVPAVTTAALGLVALAAVWSNVSLTGLENRAAGSKYAFIRDGIGRGQQSEEFRGALLHESRSLYAQSGALGAGPVSTKVRLAAAQEPVVKEAHDDYLAAIVERGVLGFIGLLALIATVVVRSVPLAAGRISHRFGAIIVNPNALLGAAAGTFCAAAVYEVLHVRHVWALFALIAALSIWGRE